ncbi:MAG: sigma-54-dependent Fis family transcriptional regulator [Phycisphaerales bacterium]|nr:sigma-54-dependent Fis family transcriptional regulator [Phycisphaerales bacterium]
MLANGVCRLANILLIEDDENLRLTIGRTLGKAGHQVHSAGSLAEAREAFGEAHFDLILSDVNLGDESGIDYVQEVREGGFSGGIIMMTAYATVDDAVRAMKLGADDYLAKPVRMQELLLSTDRLLERASQTRRLRLYQRLDRAQRHTSGPIGDSGPWRQVMEMAERLAQIPVANRTEEHSGSSGGALTTILITGETGSGKGVVARYLHDSSPERDLPFVHVNCTALPASLIESELFGHEKGAFTDAHSTREGLFEMADGGTIFLDEIGDLALPLQSKLLSVIEHGIIRKVGSSKQRPVRMRVIAATNKDLVSMVKMKEFREDLLFRINAFSITLPALRDRGGDAVLIAEKMLSDLRAEYGLGEVCLSSEAKGAISRHPWAGNVRELFNAVQRAAMLATSDTISSADLAIQQPGPGRATPIDHSAGELRFDFRAGVHTASEVERELMEQALRHTGGNVSAAAKLIGMQRSSFRYRLERYDIETNANKGASRVVRQ